MFSLKSFSERYAWQWNLHTKKLIALLPFWVGAVYVFLLNYIQYIEFPGKCRVSGWNIVGEISCFEFHFWDNIGLLTVFSLWILFLAHISFRKNQPSPHPVPMNILYYQLYVVCIFIGVAGGISGGFEALEAFFILGLIFLVYLLTVSGIFLYRHKRNGTFSEGFQALTAFISGISALSWGLSNLFEIF